MGSCACSNQGFSAWCPVTNRYVSVYREESISPTIRGRSRACTRGRSSISWSTPLVIHPSGDPPLCWSTPLLVHPSVGPPLCWARKFELRCLGWTSGGQCCSSLVWTVGGWLELFLHGCQKASPYGVLPSRGGNVKGKRFKSKTSSILFLLKFWRL